MEYCFFGNEVELKPLNDKYGVKSLRDLYDKLSKIWCEFTCAPRLRPEWSPENKTLGQCSISAFLAQDIFGGKVYGIPTDNGGVHCYNEVDGKIFDLTSEQFGGKSLTYSLENEQTREEHFKKAEKKERYEYLRSALLEK